MYVFLGVSNGCLPEMLNVLDHDRHAFGMEIERSSEEWVREWQEELNLVTVCGTHMHSRHGNAMVAGECDI
jgi:hypothetical protein